MFCLPYNAVCLLCVLTQPSPTKTSQVVLDRYPETAIVRESTAPAQPSDAPSAKHGKEFFVSWGYNGDSYASSDLHISQSTLGNDFTLAGVRARDSKAWTSLFTHSLFVPQYNLRVGFFFNEKWGLEVALDHMKWIVRQDQTVQMNGTLNGVAANGPMTLTTDVLRYQLNNGANPVFLNLVRRVRLRGEPGRTGSVFFLAKAGGGPAMPHTENVLFGEPNEKGFQFFHGWDLDAGAAARIHIFKSLYFEVEDKFVYVRYFGVKVDRGTARHSIRANEFTWNFGVAFR